VTSLERVDWAALPAPVDDGGADHLVGLRLPSIELPSTDGTLLDLSALCGLMVIYAYPMTGRPDAKLPEGWDTLPGARGCTPQACAFRDHFSDISALGVSHLFGISTQDTAYQREAVERLHLPYQLLSDASLNLSTALRLPTFVVKDVTLLKRLTLIVADAQIAHVFYPVFPPDRSATDVVEWLSRRRQ